MQRPSRSKRLWPWLGLAGALLATALVYWPGTHGAFLLDDYPNIVDNPAMHHVALTPAAMLRATRGTHPGPFGRPVAMMSFALNAHFTGLNQQAMKRTNLAIHLLNGVLVFVFLRLLLREYVRRDRWEDIPLGPPSQAKGEEETAPSRAKGEEEAAGFSIPFGTKGVAPQARGDAPPPERRRSTRSVGTMQWLAPAVTAAWLLAPINLTAVLYTVQRMTSLAATFTLAALILFVLARHWLFEHRRRLGATVLLLVAALVCVPLGVLTKESAVLTLLYALVIEWVFFRFRNEVEDIPLGPPSQAKGEDGVAPSQAKGEDGVAPSQAKGEEKDTPFGTKGVGAQRRGDVRPAALRAAKGPPAWGVVAFFTVFLLLPLVAGLVWIVPHDFSSGAWAARGFTLGERLLTEGRVIWHYIYWTLVPDISRMTLFHDAFPVSRSLVTPWWNLPAWIGVAGLLAAGLACARRWPLIGFGLLWFLVGQLLTASFVPLELVFEHREYLPSLGLLLGLFSVLLLARPRARVRRLLVGCACLLIVLYAGALTLRSLDWSNPLSQTAAAARTHPDSPRATYAYASELANLSRHVPGLTPKAIEALKRANRVPGQGIIALSGLVLLAHADDTPPRPEWFREMADRLKARPMTPQDIGALNALVHCATREKHPCTFRDDAMQSVFDAALTFHPYNSYVRGIHGKYLLNGLDRPRAAAEIYRRLVKHHPNDAGYRFSLGVCLARAGDIEGARGQLARLRRLNRYDIHGPEVHELERLIQQPQSSQ